MAVCRPAMLSCQWVHRSMGDSTDSGPLPADGAGPQCITVSPEGLSLPCTTFTVASIFPFLLPSASSSRQFSLIRFVRHLFSRRTVSWEKLGVHGVSVHVFFHNDKSSDCKSANSEMAVRLTNCHDLNCQRVLRSWTSLGWAAESSFVLERMTYRSSCRYPGVSLDFGIPFHPVKGCPLRDEVQACITDGRCPACMLQIYVYLIGLIKC